MIRITQKYSNRPKAIAFSLIAAIIGFSGIGLPLAASASTYSNNNFGHKYVSSIHELNNTHVSGNASFMQVGRHLTVTINATGLEPGVHPIHIHGKDQAKAECPTASNDTNGDGYVSVIEGAPAYGLIKLNLTSPQTAFGTPPTPALFYPFAGTPKISSFPFVGTNGVLHFSNTFTFNNTSAAQAAFKSLKPLGDQAVVIHGAIAPQSVDAAAFAALGSPLPVGYDPSLMTYDALLPVGCGTINAVIRNSTKDQTSNNDEASTASMVGSYVRVAHGQKD